MLVKCKICGNKNEKADSYCIVVNGKNNYYCSEMEYNAHQKEKEYKDLFYNELCECFGYEIKSSMLWKTIAEYKELYSYEILYHTIIEKKSDIVRALPNLVNASEINKICGFCVHVYNSNVVSIKIEHRQTAISNIRH